MATIHLATDGQRLIKVACPKIASGDKNADYLRVDFCPSWDGLGKTAVFYRNENDVYYAVMDVNNECLIPWEVLQTEGFLYLGVFGSKDEIRKTSEVISYKIDKGAIVDDLKPSDPTPDIYDQLLANYAAVARSAENAHTKIDDHVGNKSNPHGVTIAQIGAAPSGYGLGTGVQTALDYNPDNIVETGFYKCELTSVFGNNAWCIGIHEKLYDDSNDYAYQRFTSFEETIPRTVQRLKTPFGWSEWEWENPPMKTGVEYRTTERWNGKAVYCKTIYFGALPASTTASVAHGITGKTENVKHLITTNNSSRILTTHRHITDVLVNDTSISLTTTSDLAYTVAFCTLWYTKD